MKELNGILDISITIGNHVWQNKSEVLKVNRIHSSFFTFGALSQFPSLSLTVYLLIIYNNATLNRGACFKLKCLYYNLNLIKSYHGYILETIVNPPQKTYGCSRPLTFWIFHNSSFKICWLAINKWNSLFYGLVSHQEPSKHLITHRTLLFFAHKLL